MIDGIDAWVILNVYALCVLVFMYFETFYEYCNISAQYEFDGLQYDFDMYGL